MERAQSKPFSGPVTVFQERWLPEEATPTGYAALIDAYALATPVPRTLSAIGPRHKVYELNNPAKVRRIGQIAEMQAEPCMAVLRILI